jgi:hypothetical protein
MTFAPTWTATIAHASITQARRFWSILVLGDFLLADFIIDLTTIAAAAVADALVAKSEAIARNSSELTSVLPYGPRRPFDLNDGRCLAQAGERG